MSNNKNKDYNLSKDKVSDCELLKLYHETRIKLDEINKELTSRQITKVDLGTTLKKEINIEKG
jgi:hypothetical protein